MRQYHISFGINNKPYGNLVKNSGLENIVLNHTLKEMEKKRKRSDAQEVQ
nr:unnamed protein product [Callosobruchus chinensis]